MIVLLLSPSAAQLTCITLTATACLCDSMAHLMVQALPCQLTHYPHPCPILSTGQRLVLMSPCRVIASQASVPLVYIPLEAVASKWYGESERLLSEVFKAAEMLPGCIIFLDEVDSLATSRYEYFCALWTALKSVVPYAVNPFLTGRFLEGTQRLFSFWCSVSCSSATSCFMLCVFLVFCSDLDLDLCQRVRDTLFLNSFWGPLHCLKACCAQQLMMMLLAVFAMPPFRCYHIGIAARPIAMQPHWQAMRLRAATCLLCRMLYRPRPSNSQHGPSRSSLSCSSKASQVQPVFPKCFFSVSSTLSWLFVFVTNYTALYRNSEMHEATRRLLGVLLRHLDGFETNKRSVVIAATNRKEDLDPALLSRSPLVLPPHLDHSLLLLCCWAAPCVSCSAL